MPLGARIRAAFGPLEPAVSKAWRGLFIDLEEWCHTIARWVPAPRRILEVGCGEGYSTALLASTFPGVPIDAIDIADNLGRLYDGPPEAARFRKAFVQDIAAESPGTYDLAILTDVLHHIPAPQRPDVLAAIRATLAPGAMLAIKDWERAPLSPVHWVVHGADRWLTGDRVAYLKAAEAGTLVRSVFGPEAIRHETKIRPWPNNYAFGVTNG